MIKSFSKTIENGGTITENTLTDKYYLWTLLEENDENTRIEKSEVFLFDNETQIITFDKVTYEDIDDEHISMTLKATISDEHSELRDYSFSYRSQGTDTWINVPTSSKEEK